MAASRRVTVEFQVLGTAQAGSDIMNLGNQVTTTSERIANTSRIVDSSGTSFQNLGRTVQTSSTPLAGFSTQIEGTGRSMVSGSAASTQFVGSLSPMANAVKGVTGGLNESTVSAGQYSSSLDRSGRSTGVFSQNLGVAIGFLSSAASGVVGLVGGFIQLEMAQVRADQANVRLEKSNIAVQTAQNNLAKAIATFGADSQQAALAQDKLKAAQDQQAVASDRAKVSNERLSIVWANFANEILPNVISITGTAFGGIQALGKSGLDLGSKIGGLRGVFSDFVSSLTGANTAATGLKGTLAGLSGPLVIAAAGVAALVLALKGISDNAPAIRTYFSNLSNQVGTVIPQAKTLIDDFGAAFVHTGEFLADGMKQMGSYFGFTKSVLSSTADELTRMSAQWEATGASGSAYWDTQFANWKKAAEENHKTYAEISKNTIQSIREKEDEANAVEIAAAKEAEAMKKYMDISKMTADTISKDLVGATTRLRTELTGVVPGMERFGSTGTTVRTVFEELVKEMDLYGSKLANNNVTQADTTKFIGDTVLSLQKLGPAAHQVGGTFETDWASAMVDANRIQIDLQNGTVVTKDRIDQLRLKVNQLGVDLPGVNAGINAQAQALADEQAALVTSSMALAENSKGRISLAQAMGMSQDQMAQTQGYIDAETAAAKKNVTELQDMAAKHGLLTAATEIDTNALVKFLETHSRLPITVDEANAAYGKLIHSLAEDTKNQDLDTQAKLRAVQANLYVAKAVSDSGAAYADAAVKYQELWTALNDGTAILNRQNTAVIDAKNKIMELQIKTQDDITTTREMNTELLNLVGGFQALPPGMVPTNENLQKFYELTQNVKAGIPGATEELKKFADSFDYISKGMEPMVEKVSKGFEDLRKGVKKPLDEIPKDVRKAMSPEALQLILTQAEMEGLGNAYGGSLSSGFIAELAVGGEKGAASFLEKFKVKNKDIKGEIDKIAGYLQEGTAHGVSLAAIELDKLGEKGHAMALALIQKWNAEHPGQKISTETLKEYDVSGFAAKGTQASNAFVDAYNKGMAKLQATPPAQRPGWGMGTIETAMQAGRETQGAKPTPTVGGDMTAQAAAANALAAALSTLNAVMVNTAKDASLMNAVLVNTSNDLSLVNAVAANSAADFSLMNAVIMNSVADLSLLNAVSVNSAADFSLLNAVIVNSSADLSLLNSVIVNGYTDLSLLNAVIVNGYTDLSLFNAVVMNSVADLSLLNAVLVNSAADLSAMNSAVVTGSGVLSTFNSVVVNGYKDLSTFNAVAVNTAADVQSVTSALGSATSAANSFTSAVGAMTSAANNASGPMSSLAGNLSSVGSQAGSAASQVRSLASAISSLQDKTVTVTTRYVTSGTPTAAAGLPPTVISHPMHLIVGEAGPELVSVIPIKDTSVPSSLRQPAMYSPAPNIRHMAAGGSFFHYDPSEPIWDIGPVVVGGDIGSEAGLISLNQTHLGSWIRGSLPPAPPPNPPPGGGGGGGGSTTWPFDWRAFEAMMRQKMDELKKALEAKIQIEIKQHLDGKEIYKNQMEIVRKRISTIT